MAALPQTSNGSGWRSPLSCSICQTTWLRWLFMVTMLWPVIRQLNCSMSGHTLVALQARVLLPHSTSISRKTMHVRLSLTWSMLQLALRLSIFTTWMMSDQSLSRSLPPRLLTSLMVLSQSMMPQPVTKFCLFQLQGLPPWMLRLELLQDKRSTMTYSFRSLSCSTWLSESNFWHTNVINLFSLDFLWLNSQSATLEIHFDKRFNLY